jgi:hypothetical protein
MTDDDPAREHDPTAETAAETPLSVGTDDDPFAERPEAFVGAAFAGGLMLAMILRRFAR